MKVYQAYSKIGQTPVIDENFASLMDFLKAELLASANDQGILEEPGDQIIIERIDMPEEEYIALSETEGLY